MRDAKSEDEECKRTESGERNFRKDSKEKRPPKVRATVRNSQGSSKVIENSHFQLNIVLL